jgi:flagellar hook-associated protein FlgK
MGVISDLFKAQLEELQRQDEELQRDIQDTIKRCNVLLDKLTKLDEE